MFDRLVTFLDNGFVLSPADMKSTLQIQLDWKSRSDSWHKFREVWT